MSALRPHELLRLSAQAANLLPADAPAWAHDVLRTIPWVVVRRAAAPSGAVAVGMRGSDRSQRYGWFAECSDIRETVTPEDLVFTDPRSCRDVPAIRALCAVRAILRDAGVAWGPTGSVGFELATGIPTATDESDLDLVVRAPCLGGGILDRLAALSQQLGQLEARIDCQVDTPTGAVALVELVSDSREVLVKTAAGPRLFVRDFAMS